MQHLFKTIEGHTEGMPVRMVIAGAPELYGKTMSERREHFIAEYDWIRRALMLEPRGHAHMSGTLFYPPLTETSDFALIFAETSGCLPMCGHATIGSITFALEQGLIKPKQEGQVTVDVPAGQVTASYQKQGHKIHSVRFTNVPSFLLARGLRMDFKPLGELIFDIAYGGNFYPIIEPQAHYPGCEHFTPAQLLDYGWQLQQQVNHEFSIVHPENPGITGVKHCMWAGKPSDADGRSVVIAGSELIDRSPCGTGTSARVAQRFFKGLLKKHEPFKHESLIGSYFIGRVEEVTVLADGTQAVLPSVEGRAFITGENTIWVNKTEPYWNGFSLNDFSAQKENI
ncbi:hydroxyproline-2-epimerase [Ventosimonas gracilis]|uniref:Hydroxyproline-2-epimerase n=1 Tax=Ventosimonas gracilis TaxID=1680762 RepID=A0A139SIC8_9GAMM|nr:4-hydroxyproline epimerase [Ventosimonas gracilis]KXU34244.1 hydroxyproline-2-epimerase [Ventosimonas gracilis]